MLSCMKPSIKRPPKKAIGRIAENQPKLLNLLLAYFVFEWQSVRVSNRQAHGVDQTGMPAEVPDYIQMWTDPWGRNGVDTAVHLLLASPKQRTPTGPGYISEWLQRNSIVS